MVSTSVGPYFINLPTILTYQENVGCMKNEQIYSACRVQQMHVNCGRLYHNFSDQKDSYMLFRMCHHRKEPSVYFHSNLINNDWNMFENKLSFLVRVIGIALLLLIPRLPRVHKSSQNWKKAYLKRIRI